MLPLIGSRANDGDDHLYSEPANWDLSKLHMQVSAKFSLSRFTRETQSRKSSYSIMLIEIVHAHCKYNCTYALFIRDTSTLIYRSS